MDEQPDVNEEAARTSRRQVLAGMGLLAGAGAAGVLGASAASATPVGRPRPVPGASTNPIANGAVGASSAFPADTPGLTYRVFGPYDWSPQVYSEGLNTIGGAWTNVSAGYVLAPFALPKGAVIKEFSATVTNTFGSSRELGLESFDGGTGLGFPIASISFASVAGLQTSTLTLPTPHTALSSEAFDLYAGTPANGSYQVWGARIGYVDPAPGFHPLTPTRVYDSRWSPAPSGVTTGPLSIPNARVVSVADGRALGSGAVNAANIVPAGASAITYNLTVVGASAGGFLAIAPGGAAGYAASAINWNSAGQVIANGGVVPMDGSRRVKVFGGAGSADFIIDVTGYYG